MLNLSFLLQSPAQCLNLVCLQCGFCPLFALAFLGFTLHVVCPRYPFRLASTMLYNSPYFPVFSRSKNNARTSPLIPRKSGSATILVAIASACAGVIFILTLVYWFSLDNLDAMITSAVPSPKVEFITANVGEPPMMTSCSSMTGGTSWL